MDIADLAAKGAAKISGGYGKRLNKKTVTPVIDEASTVNLKNTADDKFRVGFAKKEVMPRDVTSKKYYVAGYKINNVCTGVYDPMTVSAMWIDCKSDEGIILVSVDAVGLTGHDVNEIRNSLADFKKKSGCRLISISCSHTHAGIDTVGYWGPLPKTGKDKAYMKQLFAAIGDVCRQAYRNRTEGNLYCGYAHCPDVISDGRFPYVLNDKLSRIRFVPDDGSTETWFMNFSAHPNTMGGACTKISADYPYYLRETVNKEKKTNVMFSVGAIAATNIAELAEDRYERTKIAGEMLGNAALKIDNDVKLTSEITFINQPYYAPIDNYILALMPILKVCSSDKYPYNEGDIGLALKTEMTYLKLGQQKILILPGEIFCELVYGGYTNAEESATGIGPEINPVPLVDICGDKDLMIFGVSNDMTGYIVPPNDAVLHPTQAYLSSVHDRFDRNHYHETNSLGKNISHTVADEFKKLCNRM